MTPAYKKISYTQHGSPSEVIEVQSVEKLPELPDNHVLVRLIASPINPSDIGTIQGSYGSLPELPATPGREGIGEVFQLGPNVDPSWAGKTVRMPTSQGAWQECCAASVDELLEVPPNLDPDMAAQAFINPPTAYLLLREFVELQPGDWIIQNAANSAVGHCVIQLAKHWGFKTINIVRDPSWKEALKEQGADVVITENSDWTKDLKLLTNGNLPKLGLNSVGGLSVANIVKVMAQEGIVVTFGGMTKEPIRFPTRYLIFNDVNLRGFWLEKYLQSHTKSAMMSLYNEIFQLIKSNVLTIPVAKKYSLEAVVEALQNAQEGNRRGKILLQSHWWPHLNA